MKKFICKLFRCCPAFSMEDAARKMNAVIRPEHPFRIVDSFERSTGFPVTRHFEISVYATAFMFVRDDSLEVAVNKILVTYRQQV